MPKGYFIEPTVFVEPAREADVWQKEIFGPVLSVRGFSTEKQVNFFSPKHSAGGASVPRASSPV